MSDRPVIRTGLWQSHGAGDAVADNLSEIAEAAGVAAGQLDLLVFPECFLTGYYTPRPVPEIAARVTPTVIARLARLSAETGIALVVGSYETDPAGIFNSAFVFTPGGGHAGTYRKRMLFGAWEQRVFVPGRAPVVFDLVGAKVGVLICYDVEFPERARELALRGADLIVTPTALMAPYDTVATITVPARAIENQCFIAYANRSGRDAAHRYLGQSRIVDPMGRPLAQAGDGRQLVVAALDLADRDEARRDFDYLKDLARG